MLLMDKDMSQVKLQVGDKTYYFTGVDSLYHGLEQGGLGITRMANYIVKDGKFIKHRSIGVEVPNLLIAYGREEINQFFDQMENI